ncbi:hypothetical protein RM153_22435 (plasmid) [Pantoea agglomerans]|uniref:hypothetical protein n=1 Tax=Enterobacter agglomerans TaxID=549 RepID=UPI0028A0D263|nr:hypothetical protein [Pantoea agglomerans]WNK51261.1 hypothetical protein RM153_22435 [Pantoea agglomerans]
MSVLARETSSLAITAILSVIVPTRQKIDCRLNGMGRLRRTGSRHSGGITHHCEYLLIITSPLLD